MRILMLVDGVGPTVGGGERLAMGLASELSGRGHELVLCVTRGSTEEERAPLERAGVRVLSLDRRSAIQVGAFRPLLRLMREEDFEVLHSHKFGSNVWGVLFGRLRRVPVIVAQEQTWSYQGRPHRKLLDSLIGRLSSAFVAVSTADRERMISREHVPARKIRVIPNAYVPRPEPATGNLRGELDIPSGAPIVGTVAQLRPQKAQDVLLRAFVRLLKTHPDARLVIAGEGECRQELEDLARELGVAERVHFLGLRNDLEVLLAGFDVAAMSSDFEGTPLFVAECMTNGTPLVATDVGGIPDLVQDGRSALLVPPQDPEALAAAIGSLLSDPEFRGRIAAVARDRSAEFTIERTADRFTSLYESLLAEAR